MDPWFNILLKAFADSWEESLKKKITVANPTSKTDAKEYMKKSLFFPKMIWIIKKENIVNIKSLSEMTKQYKIYTRKLRKKSFLSDLFFLIFI